jgi:hypothetical protein
VPDPRALSAARFPLRYLCAGVYMGPVRVILAFLHRAIAATAGLRARGDIRGWGSEQLMFQMAFTDPETQRNLPLAIDYAQVRSI